MSNHLCSPQSSSVLGFSYRSVYLAYRLFVVFKKQKLSLLAPPGLNLMSLSWHCFGALSLFPVQILLCVLNSSCVPQALDFEIQPSPNSLFDLKKQKTCWSMKNTQVVQEREGSQSEYLHWWALVTAGSVAASSHSCLWRMSLQGGTGRLLLS